MSDSSVLYSGSVVNSSIDTMSIFPNQLNNISSEIESLANTVMNANGFSEYVNTFGSGTFSSLIESCAEAEKNFIQMIRNIQIQILAYSNDSSDINAFVRSLSYDEYHSLDLSPIESQITEETRSIKEDAIFPHSKITDEERERRMEYLMPDGIKSNSSKQERTYITTVKVPIWTGTEIKMKNLRVNSKLADRTVSMFQELADNKFPIDYNKTKSGGYWSAEGYFWKSTNGRVSDHGYGAAFDINTKHNPFVSGENNDTTDYKVNEKVVNIMAKYGFYWGGDWDDKQDYMHFSYTGR